MPAPAPSCYSSAMIVRAAKKPAPPSRRPSLRGTSSPHVPSLAGQRLRVIQLQRAAGNRATGRLLRRRGRRRFIQRAPDDAPTGALVTSRGAEPIKGTTVTSSATSIQDQLAANAGKIDNQINQWALNRATYVGSQLIIAANSFKNWYDAHPKKSSSAGFVVDVLGAGLGILTAAFPPAGLATSLLAAGTAGLLSVGKDSIVGAMDPKAAAGKKAGYVEQQMLNRANALQRALVGFAGKLKKKDPGLWNDVGIALNNNPYRVAEEELETRAGLPSLKENYAEKALAEMILKYLSWEHTKSLKDTWLFVDADDLEWAFISPAQRRKRARAGARAQLGTNK